MWLFCFSLHSSGPEWTQEAKHTGLQEVLVNFLSSWSSSFIFFFPLPTHSHWDLFLCQQPFISCISPESLFLLCLIKLWTKVWTNWLICVCIPDSHPESVQLLLTDFKFQGICHHFVFSFRFVFWISFSYASFIIKAINPTEEDGRKKLVRSD